MSTLQNIKELMKADRLDEALSLVAELDQHDADVVFTKGKILWRLGRRSEATTAYATADALDPDGPASHALEQARAIENFFNPDLLNP